jgi:hypothetical protein
MNKEKTMRRNLTLIIGLFATLLTCGTAFAACTAANPNASVIEATPSSAFIDNGDGTVTHELTALTWDRCSVGQSWNGGSCDGTASYTTWTGALTAAVTANTANHLGYSDWRLPNVRELLSIVEPCGHSPAINQTLFPGTPAYYYFSASTSVTMPSFVWLVYFADGYDRTYYKTSTFYARLVRGGQSLDPFDALAPSLSAVGVGGTTASGTTLTATSDLAATGYYLVVPQGSAAPTPAEVNAGSDYGAVTVAAAGNGSMDVGTEATFPISGLAEAAAYDIYLVAYEANNNALSPVSQVSVTTLDATPDAFTFTDQNGVALDTLITSDAVTLSGLTTSASISVSGGEYELNTNGSWSSAAGTVVNGDSVRLRTTSSTSGETAVDVVLDINGVSDTFTITTETDTDGDGVGDSTDADDDGDGVADGDDAFPLDAAESVDTDNDGTGNNADTDDDGDGVADGDDAFPLDAAESVDTDNDGIGNNADTDDDSDGVPDGDDAFPLDAAESVDTDNDGIGNNADTDDDGDGVPDGDDAFPLDAAESIDTDGDGIGNNADTDDDGDGVPDGDDAFPLDAAESIDTDGDGIGNNADTDDDGDGVEDVNDAYPLDGTKSTVSSGSGGGGAISPVMLLAAGGLLYRRRRCRREEAEKRAA